MTKEVKAILVALITDMEAGANYYQASRMKAYMRNRYEFFGLQKEIRAEIYKPFLAQLWKLKDPNIESIVWFLWAHPCRECQYVAMEYLSKTSKGCSVMQYDGASSCTEYGDPKPCPIMPTTYAQYTKK